MSKNRTYLEYFLRPSHMVESEIVLWALLPWEQKEIYQILCSDSLRRQLIYPFENYTHVILQHSDEILFLKTEENLSFKTRMTGTD